MKNDDILLVEDSPDDALLMMRALRKSGVGNEVEVVRDGAAALDLLLGPGDLPGLVLLDVRLPKVGGAEVLRRLRGDARTRSLPVVLLTSCDREPEELSEPKAADYCLPKSMDFERFLRDVQRIVGPLLGNACSPPAPKPGTASRPAGAHRRAALVYGSPPGELARYIA